MASFALRGTARELTWYSLVALTPKEAGIAYIMHLKENGLYNSYKFKDIQKIWMV